jgi:threonine/homoserine efflux transporter RhtA
LTPAEGRTEDMLPDALTSIPVAVNNRMAAVAAANVLAALFFINIITSLWVYTISVVLLLQIGFKYYGIITSE